MRALRVCQRLVHQLGISLWDSLGRCPRCIRGAFRAMFIAGVLTGIGQLIPFPTQFQTLTRIAAVALTALWMGRLLAYAFRVSVAAPRRQRTAGNQVGMARRDMMPIFVRALATVAVVTTVPGLALAQCDQAAATRCQAAASDCRAKCARSAHREEAVHACHQECYSVYSTCRTGARCS
jgi:hypothetical protein